jgi:poly(hydroxyalkanoate) depolymerase family esterase
LNAFLKKIFAATGLTRRGHVLEATATLQQALAERVAATTPQPSTSAATPRADDAASQQRSLPDDKVLDGLVREVASSPATTVERPSRFDESSFTGATGTRLFKLFEPSGVEGRALPMVVMLHGCTQDPDDFAAGTRMNVLAQELGWFVLYPAQAPRSNAHKCWNWFVPDDQRRGHGEPALIAGMTRHVMETHAIDPDRIFVAGLSAGAAMAAILAREYPDLYAGAGIHSGLAAGAAQDVGSAFAAMKTGSTRVLASGWAGVSPLAAESMADADAGAPVIVFHGDADPTVNVLNGNLVVDAVLGKAASWQATREAGTSADGRSFTRTVYRAQGADRSVPARAEQWVVHGGGHAWFGGDTSGSFADNAGPDASREMLRFFAEHPRTRP